MKYIQAIKHVMFSAEITDPNKLFVTSDLHLGHKNIIRYCNRPYEDLEKMHETLIDNWNSVVNDGDMVFILGDLSFTSDTITKSVLSRMKGLKYLVLGNHDWDRVKLNMTNPDSVKTYQERLSEKFASLGINGVFNSARLTYSPSITEPRQEFLLSHFPYKGSGDHGRFEGKERFEDARPIPNSNPNLWLLHGHVHNEWHVKDKMINVGVDVNEFKPITLTQVMKLVADSKAGE